MWRRHGGRSAPKTKKRAHFNLGNALVAERRVPEAIAQFEETVRLKPDYANAHYNLGIALSAAGRMPQAIAQLEEAVRLRPDNGEEHYSLGYLLTAEGRIPEAITQFEETVRLKPDYADARNNLANALMAGGRMPEAIAQYEEALRLKPDYVAVHLNLAIALLKIPGRTNDAVAHLEAVLRLQPEQRRGAPNPCTEFGSPDSAFTRPRDFVLIFLPQPKPFISWRCVPLLPTRKSLPTWPRATPAPAAADLDHHLKTFWEKYNRPILVICCVILAGIVGKDGWDYFTAQREEGIEKEFAAATTPAMQRAFVEAHPDHSLAGVAELQIGDAAYAANQVPDALAAYSRALDILKTGPLAARAELGLGMVKIQSNRVEEGEATLRQLVNDAQGYTPIRAEAAYHLASLAASAGRAAELQNLSTQLMQIDPNSPWTERAFTLQARHAASLNP